MKWRLFALEILPLPEKKSATDELAEIEKDGTAYANNKAAVEVAAAAASSEGVERLYAHAKDYSAIEDRRADSIISRSQSLLVGQSLLAGILTFGGSIFSHDRIYPLWNKAALAVLIGSLTVQAVLLSINATRAVKGLEYQRIGSSDLVRWLPKSERLVVKNLALLTLDSYVRSTYANDWRLLHLTSAQKCLRNIVLILAMTVPFSFYTSLHGKQTPPTTPTIEIQPYNCHCSHRPWHSQTLPYGESL